MTEIERIARGLTNLAERVEALTGPCREVDAEIDIALGKFPERAYQQRMGMQAKGKPMPTRQEWMVKDGYTTPYTASIDAAMTLADGHDFMVDSFDGERGNRRCSASVFIDSWHDCKGAATPALALTAAALRARAHLQETQR